MKCFLSFSRTLYLGIVRFKKVMKTVFTWTDWFFWFSSHLPPADQRKVYRSTVNWFEKKTYPVWWIALLSPLHWLSFGLGSSKEIPYRSGSRHSLNLALLFRSPPRIFQEIVIDSFRSGPFSQTHSKDFVVLGHVQNVFVDEIVYGLKYFPTRGGGCLFIFFKSNL